VFFKLQLVMFFEGIRSERQLIETVSLHLAHRWYLGYALDEALPDPSSLTRIRQRGLENVNIEGLLIAAGQNLKCFLAASGWGRLHAPCGNLVALPRGFQALLPLSDAHLLLLDGDGALIRLVDGTIVLRSRPSKALFQHPEKMCGALARGSAVVPELVGLSGNRDAESNPTESAPLHPRSR